ncbi:hypothetical protein PGTUg99_007183 [Puccinia graminis f. sp. tritici]|uniref:Uncharacterized protein n=1 Tax=Puccinia graminis f. sp. tritici TaxID=56615 RepID=A0A5B0QLQ2_PUCGR|nr:hypothetical protein PGTUg99_007183 [Puccinia graminis f. sp. tritici]
MVAFFDPQAQEARDHERSVTQFYAFSLQDSRAANTRLEAEIKQLRDGDKSLANQLKIENDRLKEKINDSISEVVVTYVILMQPTLPPTVICPALHLHTTLDEGGI